MRPLLAPPVRWESTLDMLALISVLAAGQGHTPMSQLEQIDAQPVQVGHIQLELHLLVPNVLLENMKTTKCAMTA